MPSAAAALSRIVASPAPPRVAAEAACLAGGVASVEHEITNGEHQTWRIGVRPSHMWPTGYAYVVGLRGDGVSVDHTVIARLTTLLPGAPHLPSPE